jgi:phage terminase large subunit-like protein
MFDMEKADHAVNFINCLKHTKGKWRGVPFELLPWQDSIIRDIFGTVKENGYRQYNTAYVEIPKKNGKSELAAAVALYMTCGDGEWGAEVYGCASDRQQASIVFDVAVDMVDQCPALKKRIKPVMSVKRLVYKPTNSFYQVLSAEAYTKHGLNVHAVIFDELHAQPNRELFDVMTKGSGDARTQPLYFLITTAGTDRNSICFEQHQKAVDIIEGRKIDPTFYPVIYGASDEDDWTSEKTWYKSNPSLGYTIDIEKVQNAYISARENAAEENIFRQLRLNQWVKQSTRWMQMDKWDACAFPVDEEALVGRDCYGGLDLSSTSDITAFVLVFPPRTDDEKYMILPYCWIPEDNMKLRVRRDHVPYDVWEKEGSLQTTEGNVIHYGFIENFIEELGTKYHIKEIAFDRWGATQMVQDLEGMGFTVVPFGQGYKDMSPPTKELMKLTLEERIAHGGHKVLRWMMDNVYVRQDPAGNIKMDKEKSTEKIDAAVATVMALDRAIRNLGTDGSVYDDRGILVF